MVLILYIAILLVIVGVIFVITSVEVVRSPKKSVFYPSYPTDYTETELNIDLKPETGGSELPRVEIPQEKVSSIGVSRSDGHTFDVVLYNDENGISLSGDGLSADDAFSLKNVIRVGKGIIEIGPDGITLRIEKTLFRFDYYRLDRLIPRDFFVILAIQGSKSAHIIVSEDSLFSKKVLDAYSLFQGK
ncbi:MAG TPA: hypothetical protein VF857_10475 [Spirochaetota bacterium]